MDIKNKVFYVYEWFNVDTGEVFYVGKGKNSRYKNVKQRNQYFLNYYNKYNCDVRKIYEKLTENEAFEMEILTIKKYREIGECKCNISDGGEGATFEKGSWNDLFRSLQYTHSVRNLTRELYDEEEYDSDNLKLKSVEELQDMYDRYQNYKENKKFCYDNDIDYEEKLNLNEANTKSSEIHMITKQLCKNIAKKYSEFEDYLKIKEDVDYYTCDFEWDDLINKLLELGGQEYSYELINCCRYNLRILRIISDINYMYFKLKTKDIQLFYTEINIQSFNFMNDGCWHIKFNTKDCNKMNRVKIDIKDIIMGIIMADENLKIYDLFYNEVFHSPIYK